MLVDPIEKKHSREKEKESQRVQRWKKFEVNYVNGRRKCGQGLVLAVEEDKKKFLMVKVVRNSGR